MIYLDTSALMKIVRPEPESAQLRTWLDTRSGELLATSALAEVELPRALRRLGEQDRLPAAAELLENLLVIEIDTQVRREAADLPAPLLRSLAALHVASAYQLRPDLSAFVTYDLRMLSAVDPAVVATATPGGAA